MMNKKNLVVLEGGLVRDAKTAIDGKIVEFSIGVDMAGSEKGGTSNSGFFDVKVWVTDSKWSPAALGEQVKEYLANGTLTKGARVSVVGQLRHERWEANGQKSSRVVIMAESLDVYNKNTTPGSSSGVVQSVTDTAAATVSASTVVDEF